MKSIKLLCLFLALLVFAGCNTDPDVEVTNSFKVHISPNPTQYSVGIVAFFEGNSSIEVIDSDGKSILRTTVGTNGVVYCDVEHHPSGVYHVIVIHGGETIVKEFIKL
ncbi:MAG: T9SS type A sorting domain-containing protein [Chryseolinea sp.]